MIIAVIFMDLLAGMEFDLFVPGFSQLQADFHLSAFWVEALISINFIGYCLSLFVVGKLSDRYGRKSIILAGLLTFIIGSIFCVISHFYGFLLLGRFLQGVGIAAPAILSFLIIADNYPLEKQQFWLSMLNGSLNFGAGLAPVIGSFITLYFHWQGNFIALLTLGVFAFVMSIIFVPQYSLSNNPSVKENTGYKILFQSRPLLLTITALIIMTIPYWVFVGISPLLYIKDLHVSFQTFGLYQGILAFTFAIGSILFGLIIHRYSQKKWLSIGLFILVIGLIFMGWITISKSASPIMITLAMLIFVIGQIIPGNILYPVCLNLMPEAKAKISAVTQMGRLIFSALSLEIVGHFYEGTFENAGMIIGLFILLTIITQFCVLRDKNIISYTQSD
jgi:DHA1 family bicyclomycin/chloramphenicol resistance-like MFS transporter